MGNDKYEHLKTGNTYKVYEEYIINATNKVDGQRMVLYAREDGKGAMYVREYDEFMEKFELIE